jgi:ABC-2 type transport system permease protein
VIDAVAAVMKKEFRQIWRDKRSLGVLLFLPIFLLVMFGYAISLDVEELPVGIVDYDHTVESRDLVSRLAHTEYFVIEGSFELFEAVEQALDDETVRAAVIIPDGLGASLAAGERVPVQVIVDGTNNTTGSTALGYLQAILGGTPVRAEDRSGNPVEIRTRVWYNPELESSLFLIPGLAAFILVVTAVVSTALSVVREKEHGTMEQIIVAPIGSGELVLGKTVPYLVIAAVSALGVFAASELLFGVDVAGGYVMLAATTLLFILACLSFGLFISTVADSQQVAFMISVLTTLLPSFLLSGFIFPIRNMPEIIQVVTYIVPARYYIEALRNIMLKGSGVYAYWEQLLGLGIYMTVLLGLSSVRIARQEGS